MHHLFMKKYKQLFRKVTSWFIHDTEFSRHHLIARLDGEVVLFIECIPFKGVRTPSK